MKHDDLINELCFQGQLDKIIGIKKQDRGDLIAAVRKYYLTAKPKLFSDAVNKLFTVSGYEKNPIVETTSGQSMVDYTKVPLEALTVDQLRAESKSHGWDLHSANTKEKVIEWLRYYFNTTQDTPNTQDLLDLMQQQQNGTLQITKIGNRTAIRKTTPSLPQRNAPNFAPSLASLGLTKTTLPRGSKPPPPFLPTNFPLGTRNLPIKQTVVIRKPQTQFQASASQIEQQNERQRQIREQREKQELQERQILEQEFQGELGFQGEIEQLEVAQPQNVGIDYARINLSSLTVPELKAEGRAQGFRIPSSYLKAAIIDFLIVNLNAMQPQSHTQKVMDLLIKAGY